MCCLRCIQTKVVAPDAGDTGIVKVPVLFLLPRRPAPATAPRPPPFCCCCFLSGHSNTARSIAAGTCETTAAVLIETPTPLRHCPPSLAASASSAAPFASAAAFPAASSFPPLAPLTPAPLPYVGIRPAPALISARIRTGGSWIQERTTWRSSRSGRCRGMPVRRRSDGRSRVRRGRSRSGTGRRRCRGSIRRLRVRRRRWA